MKKLETLLSNPKLIKNNAAIIKNPLRLHCPQKVRHYLGAFL